MTRPRLGVLDLHPIQYHAPIYQRLASRNNVELGVLFLNDEGYRAVTDRGFGVPVAWNVDLLSGYASRFLTMADQPTGIVRRVAALMQWIRSRDVVIIHGYASPWMLLAIAICRVKRIPYLMRGDSQPDGSTTGFRRSLRNVCVRVVVQGSAGGLSIGRLNDAFYQKYGAPMTIFAPHSVDNGRFTATPALSRSELLARYGLIGDRPVVMFCGKLTPNKRPLDLVAAVRLLEYKVTLLFVGDGVLANEVRASLGQDEGIVTGFVNQLEIPSFYHAADVLVLPSEIEPWGLVVNEGMAAGALPVVSDRVGAAPDLVSGAGEIYPCGNVARLAEALSRALDKIQDPEIRARMRTHASRHDVEYTVSGYERAAFAVCQSSSTSMGSPARTGLPQIFG